MRTLRRHDRAMPRSDDLTPIEARRIAEKAWGPRFNLFRECGLWHAGRFLDDGLEHEGPRAGKEILPHRRMQEIFGVGKTLREALRCVTGEDVIYSIPGLSPSAGRQRGHQPVYDKACRLVGYRSAAGIFTKTFPSRTIVTA